MSNLLPAKINAITVIPEGDIPKLEIMSGGITRPMLRFKFETDGYGQVHLWCFIPLKLNYHVSPDAPKDELLRIKEILSLKFNKFCFEDSWDAFAALQTELAQHRLPKVNELLNNLFLTLQYKS